MGERQQGKSQVGRPLKGCSNNQFNVNSRQASLATRKASIRHNPHFKPALFGDHRQREEIVQATLAEGGYDNP
jgi:hypothetical protein